jgi:hypothetical protein
LSNTNPIETRVELRCFGYVDCYYSKSECKSCKRKRGLDCDLDKRNIYPAFRYAIAIIYAIITSTKPLGIIGSVATLLAATIYQGHHGWNKLWYIMKRKKLLRVSEWLLLLSANSAISEVTSRIWHDINSKRRITVSLPSAFGAFSSIQLYIDNLQYL